MSKNKTGNYKQGKNLSSKNKAKTSSPLTSPRFKTTSAFDVFIDKYAFAISFGLIFLIGLIVFQDFIFLKKMFLYKDIGSDTLNGSYPLIRQTADYLHTNGLPRWSFNFGMGQNIFPFFLRDPFDIFLYMIGKNDFAYYIGYLEFIKMIIGGILFFLYLRSLSLNSFTCIIGSLLFAFSGFMILGGGWYQFSWEAIVLVSLLLAFEKLFLDNSWILFPIVIALIGLSMPFNLFLYGVFLAVYAAFRFLSEKEWNTKSFATLYAKLIGLGVLGVALSSFFLFSNVLQLIESPRGSGESSYTKILSATPVFDNGDAMHNITALMRLFSSDIMGTGIYFKGWQNYLEAPMFYCGLVSLLLFPLVFQFLGKRKKIIYGSFLAFWILPVLFPYFRYAFWLFTGDYYRVFSFFVAFALLFFSLQAMDKLIQVTKFKPLALIITAIVLLVIISYDYSGEPGLESGSFNKNIISFVRIFIIIYAVLIYLLSMPRMRSIAKVFLLILLCMELGYFSSITVNKRSIVSKEEFKSKEGYNDYTVEAIDYLKQHDKSFYRVDKNYSSGPAIHGSYNDGMAQDYFGTQSYHSFNQIYYIGFLQAIGVARKGREEDSRWAAGLATQPIAESIGCVKYFLSKSGYPMIYDSITQLGDVKIMRNRYYMPLGISYSKFMLRSDFDQLPVLQRDFAMLKAFVINDNEKNDYTGFDQITMKDTISNYTYDMYANDRMNLMQDTLAITEFGQNDIRGKIKLDKKKLLFLAIPFDKGWTAKVDGVKQEIKIVDGGMSGLLVDKGTHTVELEFFPRLVNAGMEVSLVSLVLYGGLIVWWRRRKSHPTPEGKKTNLVSEQETSINTKS